MRGTLLKGNEVTECVPGLCPMALFVAVVLAAGSER